MRLVDWRPFVWLVCLVCVVTLSGVSITGDRFVCLVWRGEGLLLPAVSGGGL